METVTNVLLPTKQSSFELNCYKLDNKLNARLPLKSFDFLQVYILCLLFD
jgi:hypothetical protein